MRKVVKLFLYRGFLPIDINTLKIGTILDFDCYIQRFNGFVIIIEQGTLLDETTYQKIAKNNLPIYIATKSYESYKLYNVKYNEDVQSSTIVAETLNLDIEIQKSLALKEQLEHVTHINEELKIIYLNAKNILNAWLSQNAVKKLPIDVLNYLVEQLVSIVNNKSVTFSKFNTFLDDQDSLAAHNVKVAFFSLLVGHELGLNLEDQRKLTLAALLHDIGKYEVDENLIIKPDFLTELEHQKIQAHSVASIKLVKQSGLKDRHILAAIKDHHERLDGSGYPSGLQDKRISKFGKIIAVCDMFDSLITVKRYRGAYTTFNALSLMRYENKNKLDMVFVNILIKLLT
ncbi:MAG: HD domain-containing protein [Sulfurospirillaceae bacterium]|nr:HD domain-containing protein [Sulfurospirillaceae bacterium]